MEQTKDAIIDWLLGLVWDAVILVDAHGRIINLNHTAERMFGYNKSELKDQLVEILVPPDIRDKHAQFRERFYENPQRREFGAPLCLRGWRKDGKEIQLDVMLSPVVCRDGLVVIALIRQLDDQKEIVSKLQTLLEKLQN
jgi:PAS domain S-box-containing protein